MAGNRGNRRIPGLKSPTVYLIPGVYITGQGGCRFGVRAVLQHRGGGISLNGRALYRLIFFCDRIGLLDGQGQGVAPFSIHEQTNFHTICDRLIFGCRCIALIHLQGAVPGAESRQHLCHRTGIHLDRFLRLVNGVCARGDRGGQIGHMDRRPNTPRLIVLINLSILFIQSEGFHPQGFALTQIHRQRGNRHIVILVHGNIIRVGRPDLLISCHNPDTDLNIVVLLHFDKVFELIGAISAAILLRNCAVLINAILRRGKGHGGYRIQRPLILRIQQNRHTALKRRSHIPDAAARIPPAVL